MEYVYSALLLYSLGKEISENTVKKVIESTGEKADEAKIKALITSLKDVDIKEAINKAVIPQAAPVSTPTTEKKEEKPEEKSEEKEEQAAAGLGALFG